MQVSIKYQGFKNSMSHSELAQNMTPDEKSSWNKLYEDLEVEEHQFSYANINYESFYHASIQKISDIGTKCMWRSLSKKPKRLENYQYSSSSYLKVYLGNLKCKLSHQELKNYLSEEEKKSLESLSNNLEGPESSLDYITSTELHQNNIKKIKDLCWRAVIRITQESIDCAVEGTSPNYSLSDNSTEKKVVWKFW